MSPSPKPSAKTASQKCSYQQPENWAVHPASGRFYKTINPGAANAVRNQPLKSEWWRDMDPPGPKSILPPDHPITRSTDADEPGQPRSSTASSSIAARPSVSA